MTAHCGTYPQAYAAWQADPGAWWMDAAAGITWERQPDAAFDLAMGAFGQWFPGGTLNMAYNCLDRHVEAGRGAQPALVWDSPMTGQTATFTYAELQDRTARVAGALAQHGVGYGDRVVIYMPMVPEAVIAMLACARLGAIHSVVFGGFAAAELAKRIEDARPRAVVAASCGLEPGRVVAYKPLLDLAIGMSAHKPGVCLVLQRPMLAAAMVPGRDVDFAAAEAAATPHASVPVLATDPRTSFTPRGPPGSPRASCGTPAAMPWHCTAPCT